jgi:hypothetical protein
MCEIPLSVFNCPTRRKCIAFAISPLYGEGTYYNTSTATALARSDYAGNRGSWGSEFNFGPSSYEGLAGFVWLPNDANNGIVFQRSMIRLKDVTDGLSHTFFGGEKYISPDFYYNGSDPGDSGPMLQGMDWDMARMTNIQYNYLLYRDRRGMASTWCFGAAHPQTCNMVCCDGSVHPISYSIDPATYENLGNRINERKPLDSSKITW